MSTTSIRTVITGWGCYPKREAQVFAPESIAELQEIAVRETHLLARGMGRSYGDAANAPVVVSTLNMNRILTFDTQNGVVEAECGVLLSQMMGEIIPKGWFLPVTPGIAGITLGGAIAADVHGKNHYREACISSHLTWLEVLIDDGTIVRCSRTENADLYWNTCGGIGLTGVVVRAGLQLMPIETTWLDVNTIHASNLDALMDAFEANLEEQYFAGWIDTFATGKSLGKGILFTAHHLKKSALPVGKSDLQTWRIPKPKLAFPRWLGAVRWLYPPWMRLYNRWYAFRRPEGKSIEDFYSFFFPLDKLEGWNYLYGPRGFVQFQCAVPLANSRAALREILEICHKSSDKPFLAVIKRHGPRPVEAHLSFPDEGYSLALDFPRTATIEATFRDLEAVLRQYGGKYYMVKDAIGSADLSGIDWAKFTSAKFVSDLKRRLTAS